MPSGTVDKLLITIKGTADGVAESIDKVTASLEKLAKNLSTSGLEKLNISLVNIGNSASYAAMATKDIEGLGKSYSKLDSLVRIGSVAAGFWLIARGVKKAVDASSAYIEDINLFNVSMGEYAEEAFEYGQKVNSVLGIDIGEWARNQGVIMTLAKGFGIAGDRANYMSKQLTQLSYDISSYFNLNIEDAMKKVQSGFAGELEPLRRIGYDLSKARLMEYAKELDITKTYDAMTQAEKAQLRYYAMMKQVVEVQGDMARTIDQPANQLRVLKAQLQQATRAIGNMFIPALRAILPYAIAVVKIITDVANALARLFGFKEQEIGGFTDLNDNTAALSDNLDKATGRAKKLKKQLAGFDEINNLTTNQGSSGAGVVGGDWINFELPGYNFLKDAQNYIDQFAEKIRPLVGIVSAIGAAFLTWKVGLAALTIAEKFPSLITKIMALISSHPILAAISAVIGALTYLYMTSEDFRNFVDFAVSSIKFLITNLAKIVVDVFKWMKENIGTVLKSLASVFLTIFTSIGSTIGRVMAGALMGILKSFNNLMNGLFKIGKGIVEFFGGVFKGDWSQVWQGLVDVVKGIFQTIGSVIATPINVAIGAINGVIDSINKVQLKIPVWVPIIGGNTYSVNIKKLPFLAQGGVVDKPTTALIGENGAEAVVPLERNTEWINNLANKINDRADNTDTTAVLNNIYQYLQTMNLQPRVTVDDVGRANEKYLDRKLRIQGV